MRPQHLADGPREAEILGVEERVHALHHHGHHLPLVADDDFQPRVAVECPRQSEAEDMDGRVVVPAPARKAEGGRELGFVRERVVCVPDRFGRDAGV